MKRKNKPSEEIPDLVPPPLTRGSVLALSAFVNHKNQIEYRFKASGIEAHSDLVNAQEFYVHSDYFKQLSAEVGETSKLLLIGKNEPIVFSVRLEYRECIFSPIPRKLRNYFWELCSPTNPNAVKMCVVVCGFAKTLNKSVFFGPRIVN